MRPPTARLAAALALVVLGALAFGLASGAGGVSLGRALADPSSLDRALLVEVRAPRVALGFFAGAGLAVVGAALQGLLRNPLAEPFVLGVSGGAAAGATVALLFGVSLAGLLGAALVPLAASAGGLGATLLVLGLARSRAGARSTDVLLAGIVVNAVASAFITVAKILVPAAKAQELLFWLVGFLEVPSPSALLGVAAYVVVGAAVLVREAPRLNLLALGDEPAAHLGVEVGRTERRVVLASSLVVGAVVAVTGLIGFVGLVVPHALRRLLGPDHRALVPASFFVGGAALVVCDACARLAFPLAQAELPVGALTTLLGGPPFLWVLRRSLRAPRV